MTRNIWGARLTPYQIARYIMLRPREQRAALLERVPEHLRGLVRAMVVDELGKVLSWQIRLRANPTMPVPERVRNTFLAHNLGPRGERPQERATDEQRIEVEGRPRARATFDGGADG